MSLSRRGFLIGSGAAALALAAGCASDGGGGVPQAAPEEKAQLTFWTFLDNTAEVAKWNAANPAIQVKAEKVPAQDYYAKLQAAVKAGNAPDIALVEYQFLPTMVAAGALADLTGKVGGDLQGRFPEWVWQQVSREGKLFAVPQDIAPMGMFYRKDVFAQYGLAVPKTWQDYADAAAKLHAADPAHAMATFATNEAGHWAGFAWQTGARWFATQGTDWRVTVDDPRQKPATDLWQDLITRKLVKAEPDFSTGWINDFTTGKVATWVGPVWGGSYLKGSVATASGKWAVAPMPQWDPASPAAGNWGGSAIAATSSSRYQAQAAKFIEWLNTNDEAVASLIEVSSIYPADKTHLNAPAFTEPQDYFGGQRIYQDVFAPAAAQVKPDFLWGPTMTGTFSYFTDEFGKVAGGAQTLAQALSAVQARTVSDMKSQGFTVAA